MNEPPPYRHLRLAASNDLSADARAGRARPIPEDYGLTAADLRIWYAPGRVGAVLAGLIAVGTALMQAIDGARWSEPWILRAVSGLLSGAFIGGLAGLGAMVVVHWIDPLVGRAWPSYGRLRLYREALSQARRAEVEGKG